MYYRDLYTSATVALARMTPPTIAIDDLARMTPATIAIDDFAPLCLPESPPMPGRDDFLRELAREVVAQLIAETEGEPEETERAAMAVAG